MSVSTILILFFSLTRRPGMHHQQHPIVIRFKFKAVNISFWFAGEKKMENEISPYIFILQYVQYPFPQFKFLFNSALENHYWQGQQSFTHTGWFKSYCSTSWHLKVAAVLSDLSAFNWLDILAYETSNCFVTPCTLNYTHIYFFVI